MSVFVRKVSLGQLLTLSPEKIRFGTTAAEAVSQFEKHALNPKNENAAREETGDLPGSSINAHLIDSLVRPPDGDGVAHYR
jgi:hypothetical protein